MDEGPGHEISGVDYNLTSYSSSEDRLNESFSINFSPKPPRSAETSLRRPGKVTNMKTDIMLQPSRPSNVKHVYEKAPNIYKRSTYKQSSPRKQDEYPDYLQTIYAGMDEICKKLQMDSKTEYEGKVSNTTFLGGCDKSFKPIIIKN